MSASMSEAPCKEEARTAGASRAGEPDVTSTFEERVEKAEAVICQNPQYRWVLYRLLECCETEPKLLDELEQFVERQPGYAKLRQPPFFPIHWLEQAHALEELYVDGQGTLHAQGDVAGLSEDEFDDMVVQYAYRTTDVGRAVRREFEPKCQIETLLAEVPERADIYLDVLLFLQAKRTFAEIDRLIRGRRELEATSQDGVPLNPSVFVDKLAAVGGVFFDGGWQITEEGKGVLGLLAEEGELEQQQEH